MEAPLNTTRATTALALRSFLRNYFSVFMSPKPGDAPDGGWGWMCCLAGFMINGLSVGQLKSYGILGIEIMERFESSAALTEWINGLAFGLTFGLGKHGLKFYLIYLGKLQPIKLF